MITRFSTLGARKTICAGPCLGEYSQSELSLKKGCQCSQFSLKKVVNIATDTTILELIQCKKGQKRQQFCGSFKSPQVVNIRAKRPTLMGRSTIVGHLCPFPILKSMNQICLCLYQYDSILNQLNLFWFKMTRNKHPLTVIQILGKVI